MFEIYLVRHAVAEKRDANRWPDDAMRPLTRDGSRRFRAAADGLRRLVPTVEQVLTSPYARAWQTAEILRDVTGWPQAETSEELAAARPPGAGLAPLRQHGGGPVALVGHEPNLSALASLLIAGNDSVRIELKKGGVIALACDDAPVGGGASLSWLVTPRLLRGLAEA